MISYDNKIVNSELLVQKMKEAPFSRAKLAQSLGIAAPHLFRIIHGQSNTSFDNMAKIAAALDVSLYDLASDVSFPEHYEGEDQMARWLALLLPLSETERGELFEALQTIRNSADVLIKMLSMPVKEAQDS